jgi:hypothetical protein
VDPLLVEAAAIQREAAAGGGRASAGAVAGSASGGHAVSPKPYIVMAERMRGFDSLAEAQEYARLNVPAVILERQVDAAGESIAVEVMRHDWQYDAARGEWRVMLG